MQYRAGTRVKYRFLLHFDDGTPELVQLPDDSVQLLEESVARCTCERCAAAYEEGRDLPLA